MFFCRASFISRSTLRREHKQYDNFHSDKAKSKKQSVKADSNQSMF